MAIFLLKKVHFYKKSYLVICLLFYGYLLFSSEKKDSTSKSILQNKILPQIEQQAQTKLSCDKAKLLLSQKPINKFNDQEYQTLLHYINVLIYSHKIEAATQLINKINTTETLLKSRTVLTLYYKAYILNKQGLFKESNSILHDFLQSSIIQGDSLWQDYAHHLLGINYHKLKQYNKSIAHLKRSINSDHPNYSYALEALLKISFAWYRQGVIDSALYYATPYKLCVTKNSDHPKYNLMVSKMLQMRSFLYRQKALQVNMPLPLLEASLTDCEQSLYYLNKHVPLLHYETDQLVFNQRYNYYFYKNVEACERLYKETPNDSLLFKALYYADLDKNLSLLRTLNKENILHNLNIPTHKLDSLHHAFLQNEEHLFLLNSNSQNTLSELTLANNHKADLMAQIEYTEQQFELEYPDYQKRKSQLPELNMNYLKNLSYEKQIVEYLVGNKKLYAFMVYQGKIHAHSFEFTDSLFSHINKFRQLCNNSANLYADTSFYQLNTHGYQLYKLLLQPFEHLLSEAPLLIIPDNELNLIPFEALQTEPYHGKEIDYARLPYLVKKFDISYANSIVLLHHQYKNTHSKPPINKKVLTIVPNYEKLKGNTNIQYASLRNARNQLGVLLGVKTEAASIGKKVSQSLQLNNDANEQNFKQLASGFTYIHCAMHSLIDNENPLFSKLVFTPNADTFDDGLLNAYEIGNLSLNADMVVLSACNTSFGKLNKGEGLLSLSRAFIKAHCKSIVSTLWAVSDIKSVPLISNFYASLTQGLTKSASLSTAKRNYINNNPGSDAHPFYWSGYIVSGNDTALVFEKKPYGKYLILALLVFSAVSFFLIKRIKLF